MYEPEFDPLYDVVNPRMGMLVIPCEASLTVCTTGWLEKWHIPML